MRPGLVYGQGSPLWIERVARLLYEHRLGDLGDLGDGWCNLVHVRDVARATISAMLMSDPGGAIANLVAPEPPTWNQYIRFLAHELDVAPLTRVSSFRLAAETTIVAPVLASPCSGKSLETGIRDTAANDQKPRSSFFKTRSLRYKSRRTTIGRAFTSWREGVREATQSIIWRQ